MKPKLLFPNKFRYLGYILAVPGFILGYFVLFHEYRIPDFAVKMRAKNYIDRSMYENFTNELALTLVIVGLLFIAFSKLKREDELTSRIRLNTLYWAVLINYFLYGMYTLLNIFILRKALWDELSLFTFSVYNLFTPLLLFIALFYYLLYRKQNEFDVKQVGYLPYRPFNTLSKWLSLVTFLLFTICCVYSFYPRFVQHAMVFMPFILLVWVYSKTKLEDEYITAIRLEAMQIAIYANYVILLVSIFLFTVWIF